MIDSAPGRPESRRMVVAAAAVVAAVVLVAFFPALRVGFFSDDPWFLQKAGTLTLPEYLAFYFDPRLQVFWYRPLYGLLIGLEYAIFRTGPEGYHAVQILLHLLNCLQLFAIVLTLSRRWRPAFLSAVLYAALAPGSWAVYWISVQDPLAVLFYLLTVWLWVLYLQTRRGSLYLLSLGALAAALLSKESNVSLPLVLFLLDWLVLGQQTGQGVTSWASRAVASLRGATQASRRSLSRSSKIPETEWRGRRGGASAGRGRSNPTDSTVDHMTVDEIASSGAPPFPPLRFGDLQPMLRRILLALTALRRYAPLALMVLVYGSIEIQVQTNGYFASRQGYGFGGQVLDNLLQYARLIFFPWGMDQAVSYLALAAAFLLLVLALKQINKMSVKIGLVVGIGGFLTLAPVLGFPTSLLEPRYLYAALIVPAVFLAFLVEGAWTQWGRAPWAGAALAAVVAAITLLHVSSTSASAMQAVETARQARVNVHDIYQAHPAFLPDTYLYFTDACTQRHFTGWFFLRYGSNVTVACSDPLWGGVDVFGETQAQFAELRKHAHAYVYADDEGGHRREISVDRTASATATPDLPVNFGPIRLEGYELTSTKLERGQALALLLYWRAQGPIGRDYTVFVHLVNGRGEQVAGADSGPRNGSAPTSKWVAGELVVDGHVVEIPEEAGEGEGYRVEVGLYYLPTMERLGIVDGAGREVTDTLVLQPFSVGE